MEFAAAAIFIFLFTYLQNIVQTYVSELVARDMRGKLAAKISLQSQAYVQEATPAKLLTNLTSDVDGVKLFVSQAVASIVSSLLLIIGSSVLLLMTDWRLALAVLGIIPMMSKLIDAMDAHAVHVRREARGLRGCHLLQHS